MKTRTLAVLIGLLTIGAAAQAMIIRHDRPDSAYLALGSRYPMVGQIARLGGATLIAPEWALTAAHVAHAIRRRNPAATFGEQDVPIAEIILHPQWSMQSEGHDIALLRLAEPVRDINSAELYQASDEEGREILFVGRGDFGTGLTGPTAMDGKARGATNIVDRADSLWLHFILDSGATATELEGINGPGDSGGPTLIDRNGHVYIAGVSSWGSPGPGGRRSYGCSDGHTRVSTHIEWINETFAGRHHGRDPRETLVFDLNSNHARRLVAAYVDAFNSDADSAMTDFNRGWRSEAALTARTEAERLKSWRQARLDFGRIDVYRVAEETMEAITVWMATDIGAILAFRFELDPDAPHGLSGIAIEPVPDALQNATR